MKLHPSLLRFGISDMPARRWQESSYRVNRIHVPIHGAARYRDVGSVKLLREGSVYLMINGFSQDLSMRPDDRYYHLYFDFQALPPLRTREMQEVRLDTDPYLAALIRAAELLLCGPDHIGADVVAEKGDPAFEQGEQLLRLILMHWQKNGLLEAVRNEKLDAAIGYVEAHYHEPIQNRDIADALGVDDRHLGRLFSHALSISPHQYLTQYRVERATELLQSGMSVGAVAEHCGFQSEAAFRIAFKRVTGLAPTAIRRAEKQKSDKLTPRG